jgi:competence protein ComEC
MTRGASPPVPPDVGTDPDADGVALAAATTAGVLLGARFPLAAAWVAATLCLVVAGLGVGRGGGRRVASGNRAPPGTGPIAGVLVIGTLLAAGAAASSVRATAVQRGVLAGWIGRPGRVEVTGAVAEEPRRVRYGGSWVVLAVDRVRLGERTLRTRERAGLVLGRDQGGIPGLRAGQDGQSAAGNGGRPARDGSPAVVDGRLAVGEGGLRAGYGRLAVGERLRVRASVAAARWGDPLGRQPRVVLRRPVIEERAPPGGGVGAAALRASEVVRDAARRRALATLAPERAGLLVGMALGDTSLLPGDLEGDFRAAGLTHLMAVSGANLAVVLGAGLWLAGVAGAGRRTLAVAGAVLVVLLVVVTRWEPSVLRAGVMAGLVLFGVATGRGPGGRRALCLAVVVLLLADPALVAALGFQLSVAATAGVLWLGPGVTRALPEPVPERVRKGVGMTLGAQAAAVPVIALALGPVSLAGLPANLLGLPLAGGPMLLGVVAAATAPVAPWAATLACRLADPFLAALIAVARWAAGLPGGTVTLTGPARAGPAAVVLLVLLVVVRRRPPYLARPVDPPPHPERTVRGRADHRRRAPPGGVVPP